MLRLCPRIPPIIPRTACSMPRQRDRDISTRGRRQAFREDTPTVFEGIDDALETEPRPSTSRGRWTPPPWTPDELVFCRENHISHRPLTSIVDGVLRHHGSGAGDLIPRLYRIIKGDPITNASWESAGLGDFYSAVVGFRSPRGCGSTIVRALLEYFWDTTNTFHFAWGKMTMTPLDFSMISGLRFTERPVLQIPDLTWGASEAAELLGPVVQHIRTRPVSRGGHRSGRSELASVLAHGFDIAETTPEQRVRIFILILISGTLSHDRSSRALICYLPSLVRIGEIGSYSWASIGYADLLSSMRHGCRQLNDQSPVVVYGLWRVVELWFYEYFPGLAPRRRRGAVHDFPVGASWRDRGESRVESVSRLRGLLRRGTCTVGVAVEIQYRPWDGMTNLPEALELSACRTVFFGTTRFVWYLGERVVRQHNANHFVVSLPPPESMLDSCLLGELLDRG
ncbi:uncharacterized protein LOC110696272 isoform X2 [Chenopodium quinoa]|uniref:uncharacterized protein LOC110696272 isoform X2 n=1 Tax=Chenopodium quinoa TaxID=63459 RepID=UPI000B771C36|nr:uncharacterized protein LOC110696272 isoform X2 [Chenopodium quinoa]